MDWLTVFKDTIKISGSTILKMLYIVIPIMIVMECLKDSGWMRKMAKRCEPITKLLKLPGESAIGIIVAIFIGLTYGSGIILQMKDNVKMTRFQSNIIFIFIGICHALIEETVLFSAIGAYGWLLVINRIVMAIIFTYAYIGIEQLLKRLGNHKKNLDEVDKIIV